MRFQKLTAQKFTAKLGGAVLPLTGFPALLAAVLVLCTSTFSNSAELKPETLAASFVQPHASGARNGFCGHF
jgi:hypothetical protein